MSARALAAEGDEAAPATDAAASAGPGDISKELLNVEEQVDTLKERVFRSKATLQLLKEIVIQGASSGARATIWHENRLGGGFKLESVTYLLDGQSKFSKTDPGGSLQDLRSIKVSEGGIEPGSHNLSVTFKVRPTGYGIFSYAKNYEIDVRSSYAFETELGKSCSIRAVLTDKGGGASRFEDRARVDYQMKCERISDAEQQ